jgi:hypothetical protein
MSHQRMKKNREKKQQFENYTLRYVEAGVLLTSALERFSLLWPWLV